MATRGIAIIVLTKKINIKSPIFSGISDSNIDTALFENMMIWRADTTTTKNALCVATDIPDMYVDGSATSASPNIMHGAILSASGIWHRSRIYPNGIPRNVKMDVLSTSQSVITERHKIYAAIFWENIMTSIKWVWYAHLQHNTVYVFSRRFRRLFS